MSVIHRIRSAKNHIKRKLEGHRSGDPQLELDDETIETLKVDLEELDKEEDMWVDEQISRAKGEKIYGSR